MSLQEVLSRLVDVARTVLGARYAALGVLDPDGTGLRSFVTSGLTEEQSRAIGPLPTGRGLLGVLIRDPRPVRLHDIHQDPRSCGFPPDHPPMRSFLGVPIALRGRVFGNLYITEKEAADAFTEEDERIALTLAAQAAVAIDNVRRYEAEVRRINEMESVQEVARAILSTLDLDELLPLIVRRARRLTGADTVGVALDGPEGMTFRFAHGVDALALETVLAPRDPDRVPAHLAATLGVAEVEIAPLELGGDRVGILAALTQTPMDDSARRLLSLFANQAAVAVANAATFGAERSRLRESAQIQAAEARAAAAAEGLRNTIEAQEAERARVARELHDEAGQSLTALALNLRYLEDHLDDEGRTRLGDLRQMVNGVASSLRSLATDLRPSGLREHGLASAIERQAAKLREATGMAVDVAVEGLPADLPGEMEIALFRVIQEALTNVARHSGAGQVSVVASRLGDRVRVVVEDDGRGFDPLTPTGRLGLRGIRERVELLGGTLRIESAVGTGTAVIVDVEANPASPRGATGTPLPIPEEHQ
jgi:signal transduction histidine kinase